LPTRSRNRLWAIGAGVEVRSDKPITFGAPKRLGEYFVGNAVQSIVEVLVPQASVSQLCENAKGPTACQKLDHLAQKSLIGPSAVAGD